MTAEIVFGIQTWKTTCVIGASLSEPHTSVTALRTRVCIYACLDRSLTVNFKSAHPNISRFPCK